MISYYVVYFIKGFDNTLVGIMSKEKAKEQLQKQIEVENQRFYLEKIENHQPPPDYRMAVSISVTKYLWILKCQKKLFY